jgi:transglutaminase-like putative cysteine protease
MRSLIEAGEKPDTSSSTTYSITSSPIERFLLPRLDWLAGGRQAAGNGELHIGGTRPASPAPRVEYLDPERGTPAIDPTIRTAAGIIVGTDSDPERQIQRLVSWVAKSIAIDTAREAPLLAPTVLKTKRAGAEGHVALFVSLARATGIRARTVGGVALLHQRVYGHAWSEVWLGGSWTAVDPTFGQMPASSQLLRVNVGGSSRAIDLVPVFGSAKLLPTSGPTD